MEDSSPQTGYEERQHFNWLVAWLHSFRYARIRRVFVDLADTIKHRPIRVLDIGCAHAGLYPILDALVPIEYTGIETEPSFFTVARARYQGRANFHIVNDSIMNQLERLSAVDVVVAMETVEHIPEHDVVRLVERIATSGPTLFVCSVPAEVGPTVWIKNVGSVLMGYMRHNEYRWSETWWAGLYQLDRLPPHDTGHKGFDWRWLAQTIRHNFEIVHMFRFPFNVLPAAVSTSIFMVARPRAHGAPVFEPSVPLDAPPSPIS